MIMVYVDAGEYGCLMHISMFESSQFMCLVLSSSFIVIVKTHF